MASRSQRNTSPRDRRAKTKIYQLPEAASCWRVPWVIAGGWPLSLLLPQAEAKDIDVFSPHAEELALATAGELGLPVRRNGEVLDVGAYQFIPVPDGRVLTELVLGSFDFGIIQVGIDGDGWAVTDLWVEHAREGLIELDPGEDPWKRAWRTQARARKLHRKLGWRVGPLLTEFLRERARQGFALLPPRADGRMVIEYARTRPVYRFTEDELRRMIRPTRGPRHLLEVAHSAPIVQL